MSYLRPHDGRRDQLMNIAEAILVRVPIKTKDLHRAVPRYAAILSARTQAQAAGCEVVGDPWIEGDLGGDQVHLVWLAGRD
jgi:hypothetical protein